MFDRYKNFLLKKEKKLREVRADTIEGKIVEAIYDLQYEDHITPSNISDYIENVLGYEEIKATTVGKKIKNIGLETKSEWTGERTERVLQNNEEQLEKIFRRYLPDY